MASDDEFEPRIGRMRAGGKGRRARKFLHRVIASANLARGGVSARQGRAFTGARIGRGAGAGRMLAARDHYAGLRQRRVIVKARLVRLGGRGFEAAKAHLRYVERDGTTREGGRGELYGAESGGIDRKAWLERAQGDRHQFRFIVSPEDGLEYDDLKLLTRRLMARVEEDLGTRLDWVAVDHFNTGHPHTHIVVRGKDDRGRDLVIARDYISSGFRERARELVDLDLGPRTDDAIEMRLRAEVEQERFTSIDRKLAREAERDPLVNSSVGRPFDQAIRMGRLRKLERLGLAEQMGASHWRLHRDFEATLRDMGERGDIIRTMQRAFGDRVEAPAPADRAIYQPRSSAAVPLVGRVVVSGLADEHADRRYIIVEATDGRAHYIDVGRGEASAPLQQGAIVQVLPVRAGTRAADRTIAAVAAANDGVYSVDAHLRHDPTASQTFAEAHVRRLEAMRRLAKTVERNADGSWQVGADHVARAMAYEEMRARDNPVAIETLSAMPVEKLVALDAPTWLDRQLSEANSVTLAGKGFGDEVQRSLLRRQQWLVAEGLAWEGEGGFRYRPDFIAVLQRRELLRIAAGLESELAKAYSEAAVGQKIEGRLSRVVETASGRCALVERSRDFTLVPWRPELERQIGKPVSGILRERGVSWTIGRARGGPTIS